MDILKTINQLCTPAYLYFTLSIISILAIYITNYNEKYYCLGTLKCSVNNSLSLYIYKIVYVIVMTFLLNQLCSRGFEGISWFIILLPYILMFMFIIISIFIIDDKKNLIINSH